MPMGNAKRSSGIDSPVTEAKLWRKKSAYLNTVSCAMPTTTDTVSQIAYALGFEYPQYFSRLFKKLTGQTPQEFRKVG